MQNNRRAIVWRFFLAKITCYTHCMPWYLYIARARTGLYYVGITTDPKRRILDHNNGRGSRMALGQGPFTLVYTSEALPDQSTARKLEMKMKKWTRARKEKLIQGGQGIIKGGDSID